MQKRFLIKAAAVAVLGITAAAALTACKQKQVILDEVESGDSDVKTLGTDEGILNYTLPEKGEEIAVLQIRDYGDVKIRLFPEETPKGVENFKKLVESGYYDELFFHRVVDNFVIQTGDPKGDGTGGKDAWNSEKGFEQTISSHLCHVTGALAYAVNDTDRLNNSQFYIVTGEEVTADIFAQLRDYYGRTFTPSVESMYLNAGGQPFLDGGYEVFGQVFDGLQYCLEIQKTETDSNQKPKQAVVIEKAYLTPYDGEAPHWLNAAGEEIAPAE